MRAATPRRQPVASRDGLRPDVHISPITRETLSSRVADALQHFIIQKRLGAGDRLPSERVLSQSFQVSIPVIREALRALEVRGVLRTHHGRGIFVRNPALIRTADPDFLADADSAELATARVAFELGLVDLLCARVTNADCDALETILTPVRAGEAFTVHTDLAFHLRLLQIARNKVLVHTGEGLLRQFFRLTAIARPDVALSGHSTASAADQLERHLAIVRALRQRQAGDLRGLIHHHLDNVPGFRPW